MSKGRAGKTGEDFPGVKRKEALGAVPPQGLEATNADRRRGVRYFAGAAAAGFSSAFFAFLLFFAFFSVFFASAFASAGLSSAWAEKATRANAASAAAIVRIIR